MTREELRSRLSSLEGELNAIYATLLPSAQTGKGGRVRWRDTDLAIWLGCSDVAAVRNAIVATLTNFSVDDTCTFALLTVSEISALMERLKAPRVSAIHYALSEISAASAYLAELDGSSNRSD